MYQTKIEATVQELRQRMFDGRYSVGQRLPAERKLAEELQVSRQTIRTVLARLQQRDLIITVPSSGIYVNDPRRRTIIGPNVPPDALRYTGALRLRHETQTGRRSLEAPTIVIADDAMAATVGLEEGTRLVRRSYLCLVNQRPARFVESYYPAMLFDEVLGQDSNPYSGYFSMLVMLLPQRSSDSDAVCLHSRRPSC